MSSLSALAFSKEREDLYHWWHVNAHRTLTVKYWWGGQGDSWEGPRVKTAGSPQLRIAPLFQRVTAIKNATVPPGPRDYPARDRHTGQRRTMQAALCKNRLLNAPANHAPLLAGLPGFSENSTWEVPATDGSGPVDTMVGRVGTFVSVRIWTPHTSKQMKTLTVGNRLHFLCFKWLF